MTGAANQTGALMRDATRKWDTTRPFSGNINQIGGPIGPAGTPVNDTATYLAAHLDVEGFSHSSIERAPGSGYIHALNPRKPVISSECCSCQSQRGEDGPKNATAGITYPHDAAQAACMQRCMNLSYNSWLPSPSADMGVVAGTLGVWTLFDCEWAAARAGHRCCCCCCCCCCCYCCCCCLCCCL